MIVAVLFMGVVKFPADKIVDVVVVWNCGMATVGAMYMVGIMSSRWMICCTDRRILKRLI